MRDTTVLKHENAVGEVEDTVVVCDDNAGAVFGQRYVAQQVHHAPTGRGVERGGGLVADDEARFVDERAGDGDALLLAAGKLVRQLVRLIGDIELLHHRDGPFAGLPAVHTARDQGYGGIAGRVDRGDEIVLLEDETDILQSEADQIVVGQTIDRSAEHLYAALGRPQDAAHDRNQRRLARPALADQIGQLARRDVEIDAVKDADGLLTGEEIAGHVAYRDGGLTIAPRAHRNTAAGSVFMTLRRASQPVSAIITMMANRLISGTCQGI